MNATLLQRNGTFFERNAPLLMRLPEFIAQWCGAAAADLWIGRTPLEFVIELGLYYRRLSSHGRVPRLGDVPFEADGELMGLCGLSVFERVIPESDAKNLYIKSFALEIESRLRDIERCACALLDPDSSTEAEALKALWRERVLGSGGSPSHGCERPEFLRD